MKAWLLAGAGLVLAIGLALSVTLRPRLAADTAGDSPQPRVQAASLTTPPPPSPAVKSAADSRETDKIPAYVLGKDWRRLASAAAGPSTPIAPDPQNYYVSPLGRPPAMAADAASAAVEASAIASADGGPPITVPIVDNEATPEAAGDTRVNQ